MSKVAIIKCWIVRMLWHLAVAILLIATSHAAETRDDIQIAVAPEFEGKTHETTQEFHLNFGFPQPSLRVSSSEAAFKEFCSGVGTETPDVVVSTQRITPLQRSQCERTGVTEIGENIRFSDSGPAFIYLKVAHVGVIPGLAELFDILAEAVDQNPSSDGSSNRERVMLDSGDTRILETRSPTGRPTYTIEIGMDALVGELSYAASSFGFRDECGESLIVKSIQPSVNRGLFVVDGTVIYERWTCIHTKVPELRGLKMTWRTQTAKTKVLSQDYRICNGSAYTVNLEGNELFVRSDHFETCREALSRSHVTAVNVERIYSEIRRRLDAHVSRQVSDVNNLFAKEFGSVFEARGLSKILTAEFRQNRDSFDAFVIVVEAERP